jgi:putative methionine-R-sulfoxide reductase with GAF domain
MKKFLQDNWIILTLGLAFVTSTILAVRNNAIIEQNHMTLQQTELVQQTTRVILTQIMHGVDLGVRGYGHTQDEQMLIPYREAIQVTPVTFKRIDSLLAIQNYAKREDANEVMAEVQAYIAMSKTMIDQAKSGDMPGFIATLKEDRGYNVWKKYSAFSTPLFEYEQKLASESLSDYKSAIHENLILQFLILILGLPMLYMFVARVNRERQRRKAVLSEVDAADRKYVFNDGVTLEVFSEEINTRSVSHVRQASDFVAALEKGEYDVKWSGLNDQNENLNQGTLAGKLIGLREKLLSLKTEDERRNWTNEGLAQFSELVRTHQHTIDKLHTQSIAYLTKYLKAQQGGIFVLQGDEGDEYLELAGCYAFDKRKFVQKRVNIGDGLIGQTFLEGQPVRMTNVPQGYTHITSGLGDANPTCITIIPMRNEDKTVAVAEFASFNKIEAHHVLFLQKAGEFLAAAIVSWRNTQKMQALLK